MRLPFYHRDTSTFLKLLVRQLQHRFGKETLVCQGLLHFSCTTENQNQKTFFFFVLFLNAVTGHRVFGDRALITWRISRRIFKGTLQDDKIAVNCFLCGQDLSSVSL